ncbi:hypothetical protein K501DRAFT_200971 [Backusella circina FSU 941]|nr:hypothetical protein K501DRAFT_200971 [Backusella circina FSU 941]
MVLPKIKGTKTTRERIERLKQSRLPPNERKINRRPALDEYSTKESELRMRPSWDLRGQMTDIETLLNLENKRLEELSKAKAMMDFANREEHYELKRALIRLNDLRTENQNMKREHKENIKSIQAEHRIYNQQLYDDDVIFRSREKTLEIETNDLERRYLAMLDSVETKREKKSQMMTSLEALSTREIRLDKEIGELTDDLNNELVGVDAHVERLQKKVKKVHLVRDRLLETVKDLEESNQSRSWMLGK